MAKKQLDKLSLDMLQCEKDGFGVHYGKWKAMQKPTKIEPKGIPDGWRVCVWCGKAYKPKTKRATLYCEVYCQNEALRARAKQKRAKYMQDYRERNAINESNA
jgi:hypothetical protein